MPALAKSPALLPRIVPHANPAVIARAGSFPGLEFSESRHNASLSVERRTETFGNLTSIDRLAHDARNIISGLMLYTELLAAPGVLSEQHGHYARELESIAGSAARILERIVESARLAQTTNSVQARPPSALPVSALPNPSAVPLPAVPVTDAAEELRRLQPLLAAIAGPAIRLSVATMPCAGRSALSVEDLTRILVNLARNAADAMPAGGHIRVTAQYGDGVSFLEGPTETIAAPRRIVLCITDDGPGIPEPLCTRIFDLGFTTRKETGWPAPRRRGLGLSIVRNLVEAAGGAIRALPGQTRGARFEISLPIESPAAASAGNESITSDTAEMHAARSNSAFPADGRKKGCIECQ